LGGFDTVAFGINDSGLVVGSAENAINRSHAVLWTGSTPTDLGTLPGYTDSNAFSINSSGLIVGDVFNNGSGVPGDPAKWMGTTASALGTLGGGHGEGFDVNTAGEITGCSYIANGNMHAVVWNGTTPTDLGTLGGNSSLGQAINASGKV